MQIKIRNFGPIKEFDFDLEKDLVVIFGKNNSGKSYGIYVVYLLVKTLLNVQRSWSSTRTLPSDDVLEHEFLAEFQQAFSATFDKVDNITSRFSGQPLSLSLCTQVAELTHKKRVLTKASMQARIWFSTRLNRFIICRRHALAFTKP